MDLNTFDSIVVEVSKRVDEAISYTDREKEAYKTGVYNLALFLKREWDKQGDEILPTLSAMK